MKAKNPYGLRLSDYTLKDDSLDASQWNVSIVDIGKNADGVWQVVYFDNAGYGNLKTMVAHKFRKLYVKDPKYITEMV